MLRENFMQLKKNIGVLIENGIPLAIEGAQLTELYKKKQND
jgi:hypothetical protein